MNKIFLMTAFACGYKTIRDRKERREKVTVEQNYNPDKVK